jgi:hypothetical protein
MPNLKDNNLEELFHLSEMTDEEKAIFLADVGGLIMESAVLRFLSESDESTGEHFSHMVDAYADKDNLHEVLAEAFPAFRLVLEEESEAFREEATKVLGK